MFEIGSIVTINTEKIMKDTSIINIDPYFPKLEIISYNFNKSVVDVSILDETLELTFNYSKNPSTYVRGQIIKFNVDALKEFFNIENFYNDLKILERILKNV